jgi:hypothetical protein
VNHKSRRIRLWLTILLLLAGLWFGNYEYRVAPIRFDAARWSKVDWDDSLHRRARMADWLLENRVLSRMSRAEVISLLGAPMPKGFRDWEFAYNLGRERGLASVDNELLVLRFDPDGRVAEAKVVRD